ncbi:hypothetical protein EVAR_94880_1 [Eumeta japonica]|uniref:Uncharacterized protein n=1 Tax=Eumeta variegata TaxID=151549 RepID=A0A4C1V9U3_EUMVA|nr:hypothetical protein EVAR_94880_1 [Eumeta japonica]
MLQMNGLDPRALLPTPCGRGRCGGPARRDHHGRGEGCALGGTRRVLTTTPVRSLSVVRPRSGSNPMPSDPKPSLDHRATTAPYWSNYLFL